MEVTKEYYLSSPLFHLRSFPLFKMFSIMKHHSHKLTDSLQSKAHNDEVIIVKEWVIPSKLRL